MCPDDRWTMFPGKKKHREAMFIKSVRTNEFIGKVYGHEGQDKNFHAMAFASIPQLLATMEGLVKDIEITCRSVFGREPRGAHYDNANRMVESLKQCQRDERDNRHQSQS